LLAMEANDDAGRLDQRGVWTFFPSRLAPTGVLGVLEAALNSLS